MLQGIAVEVSVKEVVRLSAFTSFPGVIAALFALLLSTFLYC